jgi:NAD(P)H-dependent FMN reductase
MVGTNRPKSRSLQVAKIVEELFQQEQQACELIELEKIPLSALKGKHYSEEKPEEAASVIESLNESEGFFIICPEYNGSMPGALKYFIDFWSYPETFQSRPVAFIGLGGRFGGLRPVEHLQQVFGYRNAYVFPERIFITNVWNVLKDNTITDENLFALMQTQVKNYCRFVNALQRADLTAPYKS